MSKRYTIAVDFDGVLHSYTTPWINAHTIPDEPVVGAIQWLWNMLQDFDVIIHSTRCKTWRGRIAVRRWLKQHAGNLYYECMVGPGLEDVILTHKKLPALVYIDDRAYRFMGPGTFPSVQAIHQLRPWNKPKEPR